MGISIELEVNGAGVSEEVEPRAASRAFAA